MKTLTTITCLMVLVGARAQSLPTAATSARSSSGQFHVTASPGQRVRPSLASSTDTNLIHLEPMLVAISCERVKQAVWRELEFRGSWQHKASVYLRPARSANEIVTIVSDRSAGGWSYRVDMPNVLPQEQYLRAVVQLVLLELANRRASETPAEIPAWLTEGLTFHLLCNNGPELLLGTPDLNVNGLSLQRTSVDYRRYNALEKAHKILIGATPLTFEELSWPTARQFDERDGPRFRASSQLFFCELMKLRGGTGCMHDFIGALPHYLNWQMAFLHGFEPYFQRPLDVEKWWTLEAIDFAGRDLTQTWPYEESWSKLASALVEPVDVYVSTNQLPERAEVSLQTIIREWDIPRLKEVLRRKSHELAIIQVRMAPELTQLINEYRAAFDAYLDHLDYVGDMDALTGSPAHLRIVNSRNRIAEIRLLRRIAPLDVELERLRPGADQRPGGISATNTPLDIAREMRLPGYKLRAN